jgi:hypothetical protein
MCRRALEEGSRRNCASQGGWEKVFSHFGGLFGRSRWLQSFLQGVAEPEEDRRRLLVTLVVTERF